MFLKVVRPFTRRYRRVKSKPRIRVRTRVVYKAPNWITSQLRNAKRRASTYRRKFNDLLSSLRNDSEAKGVSPMDTGMKPKTYAQAEAESMLGLTVVNENGQKRIRIEADSDSGL